MNEKIKVLFFIPAFYMGGAEKVAINLMRMLGREIFEVHCVVITKDGSLYDLLPEDVVLHTLEVSKTVFSIFKLRKLIVSLTPDIIFSTLFRTHRALYLALIGLKTKPKIILRNPTSLEVLINEGGLGIIELFFIKESYKNTTLILAQTPEMKDEIKKLFFIEDDKIQVLMNPIDICLINKAIRDINNPFDQNYINVVTAGRLSREKGLDVLLKAFKLIVLKNPKYRLHIIGRDGGEKHTLTGLAKELLLENNVKFWGEQTNPYRFFYFSDLYVLSSRREGLPNTVLENLYLKKPIIATRCISFMDELICDGNNGFLVDVDQEEQLAEAILKYKDLDMNKNKILSHEIGIDKLFLSTLGDSEI